MRIVPEPGGFVDRVDEFLERRAARQEALRTDFGREGLVLRAFDAERVQHERQVQVRGVLAQAPAEREAVEARQLHVADDGVGRVGANRVERFDAGAGLQDAMAARLQHAFDGVQVLVAFVGQQDGLHRGVQAPCGAARGSGRRSGPTPLLLRREYAPAAVAAHQRGPPSSRHASQIARAGAFE